MRSKLIPILAAATVAYVAAGASANIAAGSTSESEISPANRGRIFGTVVSTVTGKPVAGAYVGVGDFGDSGGSNYSRHHQRGAVQVTEQAKVGLWTFDRKIKLQGRDYRVSELCELLSAETDSNPRIVADPAIEKERLELAEQGTPIWDLMEAIYLDRGWKLHEHGEKTLILRAGL